MKYGSRKFIVTGCGMLGAVVCAYFGILTPELANVLLAGIASYNVANAWVGKDES
jgi:hydroxyethylthiazole kinase-like sugar kinase family protein